jgi:hypothetical protein
MVENCWPDPTVSVAMSSSVLVEESSPVAAGHSEEEWGADAANILL